jgi:hypothetical protein
MESKYLLIFFGFFNTLSFLGINIFLGSPYGELNFGFLLFGIIFTAGGFFWSSLLFTFCGEIKIYRKYSRLLFAFFILLYLNLTTYYFDNSLWTYELILKIHNQNFLEGFYMLTIIHGSILLSLVAVNTVLRNPTTSNDNIEG